MYQFDIATEDKPGLYRDLRQALDGLTAGEPDAIANMANAAALIWEYLPDLNWAGFYRNVGGELVLGPFEGKPWPHTRIPLGRGICGAAASDKATIIVDDVNADPRYLACSIETKSEIVVPIMAGDDVLGEIDVDSDRPAAFEAADKTLLEAVAALLAERMSVRSR